MVFHSIQLHCPGHHKVFFCSQCQHCAKCILKCSICEPRPLNSSQICSLCQTNQNELVSVLPTNCFSFEHKFNMCFDCGCQINSKNIVCKFCTQKSVDNYLFLQSCENLSDGISFFLIKFISNLINRDTIEVDYYNCPFCYPISTKMQILDQEDEVCIDQWNQQAEDLNGIWIPLFSSCALIDPKHKASLLVTGGVDLETDKSIASTILLKLQQDGRQQNYKAAILNQKLVRTRHSHKTFYNCQEKMLYIIGGAQKNKSEEIEYLDSIECLSLDDYQNSGVINCEWQLMSIRMNRPRCSFGIFQQNNCLYIFGGISGINSVENSIEVLNFQTKKIQLVNVDQQIQIPLFPRIIQSRDQFFMMGGLRQNQWRNDELIIFDKKSNKMQIQKSQFQFKESPCQNPIEYIQAFGQEYLFQLGVGNKQEIQLQVYNVYDHSEIVEEVENDLIKNYRGFLERIKQFDALNIGFQLSND